MQLHRSLEIARRKVAGVCPALLAAIGLAERGSLIEALEYE